MRYTARRHSNEVAITLRVMRPDLAHSCYELAFTGQTALATHLENHTFLPGNAGGQRHRLGGARRLHFSHPAPDCFYFNRDLLLTAVLAAHKFYESRNLTRQQGTELVAVMNKLQKDQLS